MKLIKDGQVTVYEEITEFTEKGVAFNDGKGAEFDAVILATGNHRKYCKKTYSYTIENCLSTNS